MPARTQHASVVLFDTHKHSCSHNAFSAACRPYRFGDIREMCQSPVVINWSITLLLLLSPPPLQRAVSRAHSWRTISMNGLMPVTRGWAGCCLGPTRSLACRAWRPAGWHTTSGSSTQWWAHPSHTAVSALGAMCLLCLTTCLLLCFMSGLVPGVPLLSCMALLGTPLPSK